MITPRTPHAKSANGDKMSNMIRRAATLERARCSLWAYAQYINPDFFRDDRPHLHELCDTLQALYRRELRNPDGSVCYKLMINMPPRSGKSYTLTLFEQWAYGQNQQTKIISTSYNDLLSSRFAKGVRDGIDATKLDPDYHIFTDVFPDVHIKYGDAANQLWSLDGQYFSFLAASFGGTITGVGCSIGVIDDPIKNHIEAANEALLEDQWSWYTDTFFSRVEENGLYIIVMTRWATGDLCGRLLAQEPNEWHVIRKQAIDAQGNMLCPALLSRERWEKILKTTSDAIVRANYLQEPIDIKGRLYDHITTYDEIPQIGADGTPVTRYVINYTDTADTGADYLCSITAQVIDGEGYVLDIVYTDAPMEKTEPLVARSLYTQAVNVSAIESNNGGRGFARNVEKLLWTMYSSRKTKIIWHVQRQNKAARILTAAGFIQDHIKYPVDWEQRWPEYARAMLTYQRQGKNAHDDAPDATTGLAEIIQRGTNARTKYVSGRGARRL